MHVVPHFVVVSPDMKLEAAAASAREDKRRADAALEEAAAAARQREAQLRDEWARCVDASAEVCC
jgi:hypothetical protein